MSRKESQLSMLRKYHLAAHGGGLVGLAAGALSTPYIRKVAASVAERDRRGGASSAKAREFSRRGQHADAATHFGAAANHYNKNVATLERSKNHPAMKPGGSFRRRAFQGYALGAATGVGSLYLARRNAERRR